MNKTIKVTTVIALAAVLAGGSAFAKTTRYSTDRRPAVVQTRTENQIRSYASEKSEKSGAKVTKVSSSRKPRIRPKKKAPSKRRQLTDEELLELQKLQEREANAK